MNDIEIFNEELVKLEQGFEDCPIRGLDFERYCLLYYQKQQADLLNSLHLGP